MQKYIFILFISAFYIGGCGTMATEKSKGESNISIPKEVSFPIPKALKIAKTREDKSKIKYKKREEPQFRDFGYGQLKKDITLLESKKFILEKNLRFTNQVIKKIADECNDVVAEEPSCVISEHSYSFFDKETKKEYPLGDIWFVEEPSDSKTYYSLDVDMSYYFHNREDYDFIEDGDKVTQSIIWSADENNISSGLFFDNEQSSSEISLDYVLEANGTKYMKLKEEYIDKIDKTISTFYLALQKEAEEEHYKIDSQYETSFTFDSGGREKAIDRANGYLGEKYGYLFFTGGEYDLSEDDHIIGGQEYYGIYSTFDVDGNELNSTSCGVNAVSENEVCDLNDSSTWNNRELFE